MRNINEDGIQVMDMGADMDNDNIRAVILSGDNVIVIYNDGSYENMSLDDGNIIIEIKKERV